MMRVQQGQKALRDGHSATMRVGLAGEHLACAVLIHQGWNAFMAPPGAPYDIVVDLANGKFCRVQVKATCRLFRRNPRRARVAVPVYRFALRRSRKGIRRISLKFCDVVAFVALDTRNVAFLPVTELLCGRSRLAKTLVEFKTRRHKYRRARFGVDPAAAGKFIEDYGVFRPLGG